ncbi:unnamed protein product [Brassicogethes aeneus]|uniref:C2H2-type domain-containing protein n=1 Tax=Brassicogethes aeneus TaxID=1431903 RepID=A0A9P0FBT5_BRAAE|nr:unnamed protein product [Brassicogethes aeneus]
MKNEEENFFCPDCGRGYKLKSSLKKHMKWECGKEPRFPLITCTADSDELAFVSYEQVLSEDEDEAQKRKRKKRECERRRRQKIKNNLELYEEEKKKKRERYLRRKAKEYFKNSHLL